MKVSKAGKLWLDDHQIHSKKNIDRNISNPCDSPMLRKVFRPKVNRAYFYHQQVKQLSCFLFRYPETRKGPMEGPLDGGDTYPLGYRILL
jgi:hypothetical protein